MTEHKFTDDEIIKALKHCGSSYQGDLHSRCSNCPLHEVDIEPVACFDTFLHDLSLDLIKRYKAEIEDLEIKNEHLVCFLAEARADTSKEFAKKLHKDIDNFREKREMVMLPYTEAALLYIEKCIDNLVKEMTEGKK